MADHLLNIFSEPGTVPQFFRIVHYSASWHMLFHYLILRKTSMAFINPRFTHEKTAILIIKQLA